MSRLAASVSFLFRELPVTARFAAARAAGFDGVEVQRLLELDDVAAAAAAARAAGVAVVLVNVPSGDFVEGGDGLSGVPGREAAFEQALERALAAAQALGARYVHLGPSRVPAGVAREACLGTYHANVRTALGVSRAAGVTLLVEAMNPVEHPTALFPTVDAAAACVRAVAHARFGLQFDVYHAAMAGDDPVAAFARHRALVRHVQFADAPGRHEPGTGALDLPGILGALRGQGYAGWIGAEYAPAAPTAATLGWMPAAAARSAA